MSITTTSGLYCLVLEIAFLCGGCFGYHVELVMTAEQGFKAKLAQLRGRQLAGFSS